MSENNEATSAPEQGVIMNATQNVIADDLLTNLDATNDVIKLVATGEWEDPRTTVIAKVVEKFDAITNAAGRTQRSVRAMRDDGSTMLISGFNDEKIKILDGLKLGYTYSFRGKLKVKPHIFQGEKRTSSFLNL